MPRGRRYAVRYADRLALALRVERGAEHAARILVRPVMLLIANNARRNAKEVGRNELEARGTARKVRSPPRPIRRLHGGVGLREDAPEAAREGGEVAAGGHWDHVGWTSGREVAGRVEERGRAV